MREDAQPAATALLVANLGHRRAPAALGDARVEVAQIFRNRRDDFLALGGGGVEVFLEFGGLRFDLFFLGREALFRFFQARFRQLDAVLGVFGFHHDLELAVFGFAEFGFGVGNFMLQCAICFVGFHRAALVAVFARAVFPFLALELELLAFGVDLRERLFGRGNFGAGAGQFRVGLAKALRKRFQFGAKEGNLVVNPLQLNQMGNRRMHGTAILSHCHARPCSMRGSG